MRSTCGELGDLMGIQGVKGSSEMLKTDKGPAKVISTPSGDL